jgi:hypothetical protein
MHARPFPTLPNLEQYKDLLKASADPQAVHVWAPSGGRILYR